MCAVIFTVAEFFCWLSLFFLAHFVIPFLKLNVSDIHLMQDN